MLKPLFVLLNEVGLIYVYVTYQFVSHYLSHVCVKCLQNGSFKSGGWEQDPNQRLSVMTGDFFRDPRLPLERGVILGARRDVSIVLPQACLVSDEL